MKKEYKKNFMKILKLIRLISFLPFIFLIGIASHNAVFGVPAFIDSFLIGYDAFIMTILAYGINFLWLYIFCIILIIGITIFIKLKK